LLKIAAENFHEGRFAATVGPDQAIAIAIAKFDRNVFKQGLSAELHGDIAGDEHAILSKILCDILSSVS
jgi:hypothetical protein